LIKIENHLDITMIMVVVGFDAMAPAITYDLEP